MNENIAKARAYIKRSINLAIELIVKPADFFRIMPKSGGLLDPLLYLVMTAVLGVLLVAFDSFVSHGAGFHDLSMLAGGLIVVPLVTVILSFFVAGLFYSIWSFMGSNESYETSFRCLAYMQILTPISILLSMVPYLGLLGIVWWLYLMVTATRVVHKVSARPAWLVFGIIAALSGLVYYNSVSSAIKADQHLREFTKELQRMPGKSDTGNR